MRFDRCWHLRDFSTGATPRRVACVKRAQQKRRDRFPLFAEEIAAEQPDPVQHLNSRDKALAEDVAQYRTELAQAWRAARARVRALPEKDRQGVLSWWNSSKFPPGKPEWLERRVDAWLAGERPFVVTPEEREHFDNYCKTFKPQPAKES